MKKSIRYTKYIAILIDIVAIWSSVVTPGFVAADTTANSPTTIIKVSGAGVVTNTDGVSTVDAGEIDPGAVQEVGRRFILTNKGAKPFTLVWLSPSCNCTSAQLTGPDGRTQTYTWETQRPDVKPVGLGTGQSAIVDVEIEVNSNAPGDFGKSVLVKIEPDISRPVLLEVRYRVISRK